jgi:hypothetical protein
VGHIYAMVFFVSLFPCLKNDAFPLKINGIETPAHICVQSIHNISIECSWLCLHLEFGNSAVIVFKKAEEDQVYLSHIPEHACVHSNLLLLSFPKLM